MSSIDTTNYRLGGSDLVGALKNGPWNVPFEQIFEGCVEEQVKEKLMDDGEDEALRGLGIEFTWYIGKT